MMTQFNPFFFIFAMAALGLAPFFLMMVTSYVKIIVVTSLVRNALGLQQVPPAMVMNGLALVLTVFIMAPVARDTADIISRHEFSEQISLEDVEVLAPAASMPIKNFLKKNIDPNVLQVFIDTAKNLWPTAHHEKIEEESLFILIPSFTISELTKAFEMGFLLFLPFIAIDLIISNVLLAMGMMMVSPMTISLPFKLLLFVTLNGWLKVSQGLLLSYN